MEARPFVFIDEKAYLRSKYKNEYERKLDIYVLRKGYMHKKFSFPTHSWIYADDEVISILANRFCK